MHLKFLRDEINTIANREVLTSGGISERAGDIRLYVPGYALQNDVMSPFDVLAGGESEDLRLIQLLILIVFDTFYHRA